MTKKILLLIVTTLLPLMVSAHDIEVKNTDGVTIYYNYINNGTELEVTYRGNYWHDYYYEYQDNVVIPEEVTYMNRTRKVTSIGGSAFEGCSGLTSVTIPNSVTSIGWSAFEDCSGLTSVTIPNSVTSIGTFAFRGCSGLTSVTIPNSVTSIREGAFQSCFGLTSIEIPNSVTRIGDGAFADCTGLTSVTIPNSVTSIGGSAFYGCYVERDKFINNSSLDAEANNYWGLSFVDSREDGFCISDGVLIKYTGSESSVTIPNSVTSIGSGAFRGCSGLTSVTIGNSVTSIGDDAFYGCWGLTSVHITDIAAWCKIKFGSNPFGYAHHLFMDGKEITDLVIPNSVPSIGRYVFDGCSSLTSVTIPNSVTEIGYGAFSGCSGLTSVSIGNSLTTIGENAFQECSGLTEVHITDIAAWCKISFGSNPLSIAHHLFMDGKEITNLVIPNSVTEIGKGAFKYCYGLTSVTIPNSVTSIGDGAFSGCTGLTSVACEATSVPSTGSDVFNNVPLRSAKLYVPASALEEYKATEPWSGFGSILAIEFIAINEANFPDENFRNFILAQDYGQDGVLISTEIVPIKYMQCHNKEIKNLKGIEYFTALQALYCYQNNIKDDAMDILVNSLPNYNLGSLYVIYNEDEGNIMTATQVATAKAKGWTPYYYDGSEWKKIKVQTGNKIIIEGEIMQDISEYTTDKCTITPITIDDTRVSLRGCLQIYPKSTNGTWDVTYNIEELIPGKYNVHVVTLPKTMADETARELPVKYKLKLQYCNQDGQEVVKDCGAFASTQGEITDNVAESIDISGNNVKITLSGNANKKKASSETSEMYLDYMYLELATLRGDVNGDGVVNGTDIQAVINVIVEGEYDEKADVNEDGQVNGTDIQEVINIIVNAE